MTKRRHMNRISIGGGFVVLSAVTKTYAGRNRVSALRDISLAIHDGETVAMMGPSGSGKSTLLNLIGGLDVPTSGHVVVGGVDLSVLSERERSLVRRGGIAYVFQTYRLMPTLTCAQNVALPLHLQGLHAREIDRRVGVTLAEVGLSDRARHLPEELSGGECQRAAIARALVMAPRLLLADEPTGNLDSKTGDAVLTLLFDLQRQRRTTLVLVTHDARAAARCGRVMRMQDGQLDGAEVT